jgi:hypothetical protein
MQLDVDAREFLCGSERQGRVFAPSGIAMNRRATAPRVADLETKIRRWP